MALPLPAVIDSVAHSGASNHNTSDVGNLTCVHLLTSIDPSSIIVGNGSFLSVTTDGDSVFSVHFNIIISLLLLILFKILYVQYFTTDNWCSINFDLFGLFVKDHSTWNVITRC
jgi:hypothetical protein